MKKKIVPVFIISILLISGCSVLNENVVSKENTSNESAKKEIQEITKNNKILSEFEDINLQQAVSEENLFKENEENNVIPETEEEFISDKQVEDMFELIDKQLITDDIQKK